MMARKMFSLRLHPDAKRELGKIARQDGRSMSSTIEQLILAEAKRRNRKIVKEQGRKAVKSV